MTREYTTEIHILKVKHMLKTVNLNDFDKTCPVSSFHENFCDFENDPCAICRVFSGVKNEGGKKHCPCHALGVEKVIRRAKESFKLYEEKEKP